MGRGAKIDANSVASECRGPPAIRTINIRDRGSSMTLARPSHVPSRADVDFRKMKGTRNRIFHKVVSRSYV